MIQNGKNSEILLCLQSYSINNKKSFITKELLHKSLIRFVALLLAMPIVVTKTTAAPNEIALSHHRVCGLYFLAVFVPLLGLTLWIGRRYAPCFS